MLRFVVKAELRISYPRFEHQGRMQDFHEGGGGGAPGRGAKDYLREAHITSMKRDVFYGPGLVLRRCALGL